MLCDYASVVVADDLTELLEATKNMSTPARPVDVSGVNRALFTVGLISKHFDLADIVDETARVCILLGIGVTQ